MLTLRYGVLLVWLSFLLSYLIEAAGAGSCLQIAESVAERGIVGTLWSKEVARLEGLPSPSDVGCDKANSQLDYRHTTVAEGHHFHLKDACTDSSTKVADICMQICQYLMRCVAYEAFGGSAGFNCILFSQFQGFRNSPVAHGIQKLTGSGYGCATLPTTTTRFPASKGDEDEDEDEDDTITTTSIVFASPSTTRSEFPDSTAIATVGPQTPTGSTTASASITSITTTRTIATDSTSSWFWGVENACSVVPSPSEQYDVTDCAAITAGTRCIVVCNGEAGWHGTPVRYVCLADAVASGRPPVPEATDATWPRCERSESKENEEIGVTHGYIGIIIAIPSVLGVFAAGTWWCVKRGKTVRSSMSSASSLWAASSPPICEAKV